MKKALLVISFGTSYAETCRKNIRACEQRLAEAFPDRDLFSAFTSEMIIAKLARRDGLQIDNPRQALMRLAEAGYQDVLVQSLHIIKMNGGQSYRQWIFLDHAVNQPGGRLLFQQMLRVFNQTIINVERFKANTQQFVEMIQQTILQCCLTAI